MLSIGMASGAESGAEGGQATTCQNGIVLQNDTPKKRVGDLFSWVVQLKDRLGRDEQKMAKNQRGDMAESTKKTTKKPTREFTADPDVVPVHFHHNERVELSVSGEAVAAAFHTLTCRELPPDCRVKFLPQSSGNVLVELVFRAAAKAEKFVNG